ncbi:MAG TPA: hypothetical protein VF814_03900, partial [Casimicrobiaceae bacterium]
IADPILRHWQRRYGLSEFSPEALAQPIALLVVLTLLVALALWLLPKLWRFLRGFFSHSSAFCSPRNPRGGISEVP